MPSVTVPVAPASPSRPTTQRHLFGAIGTLAEAIEHEGRSQRERDRAEALRVSGNFYVDRMVGSARAR
jgi:hypothetical protein